MHLDLGYKPTVLFHQALWHTYLTLTLFSACHELGEKPILKTFCSSDVQHCLTSAAMYATAIAYVGT